MLEKINKKIKRSYLDLFNHQIKYLRRQNIISKLGNIYEIRGKLEYNIILITIECLRKDHLSIYGYQRKTTPFLESIKNKLAIFQNAKASSSWTWPSIASLITGLQPSQHGAKKYEKIRNLNEKDFPSQIKNDILSLPEIYSYLGGKTYFNAGGIIYAELVTSGRYMNHNPGKTNQLKLQIKNTIKFVNDWKEKPILAHIHISDTHYRLYAPIKFRRVFNAPFNEDVVGWKFTNGNINNNEWLKYKDDKIKLYDSSILYIDSYISYLHNYLEENDLLNNTIIFITSDHGEEFWDHVELEKNNFYDPREYYGISHGHNMFYEITDIPLIIYGCTIKPGQYNNYISSSDIVATTLKLLEIEHNIKKLMNKNIFDKKNYNPICEDIAYGYDKIAFWNNYKKYLISEGDNIYWMFDKNNDPKEMKPQEINSNSIEKFI